MRVKPALHLISAGDQVSCDSARRVAPGAPTRTAAPGFHMQPPTAVAKGTHPVDRTLRAVLVGMLREADRPR